MQVGGSRSWQDYFDDVVDRDTPWFDQSNAAVHAQLISVCIEAARELQDTSCIDLGCGRGKLAGALRALGAESVSAVDFSPELIDENTRRWPEIDWHCGDAGDAAMIARLPRADRVFVVELLQYVDARQVILSAWDRVSPGGRLVALCPHCRLPDRAPGRGALRGPLPGPRCRRTYDRDAGPANQRLYLNGACVAQMSDTAAISLNSAPLGIGRHVSGIADPFNGHIDEFRLADVQRSDGWIETTWEQHERRECVRRRRVEEQEGGDGKPPPLAGAGVVVCLMA